MVEWTHQERECCFWNSNVYPFLSTAGLVLAGALSPAVHGSSHGQTSFSGYLPSHVDPQHHSSLDIDTHHHNAPSTIFTSAGSWGSDLYLQDEPLLELSVGEVMKPDSQHLCWRLIFKKCLRSVLLKWYSIPNDNFLSKDSICTEKMTKNCQREKVKARKCFIKRFEVIYRFFGAACNEGFKDIIAISWEQMSCK